MAKNKGKRIERELDFYLTEKERKEKGEELAALELVWRANVEDDKIVAGTARKARKKEKATIKELAEAVSTGKLKKMVDCMEINDWPRAVMVVRLDRKPGEEGYVVEERACEEEPGEGASETDGEAGDEEAETEGSQHELPFAAGAPIVEGEETIPAEPELPVSASEAKNAEPHAEVTETKAKRRHLAAVGA